MLAITVSAVLVRRFDVGSESPFEGQSPPTELALMCPWRNPEEDMAKFFPQATSHRMETLILSGLRLELERRFGRKLAPDENSLNLHRVLAGQESVGAVLTRRVKGQYGAIEIVLALAPDRSVRGIRLQRLREPAPIASPLQDEAWLAAFQGKTAETGWTSGWDLPQAPGEAAISSAAVIEGVRSLLTMISTFEKGSVAPSRPPH